MPLIPCQDCGKEVSPRAPACPNCGCPISQEVAVPEQPKVPRPNLAEVLDIGKQVVNWSGSAGINGHYDSQENSLPDIPDGTAHLILHKNGIQLAGKFYVPLLPIHFSQILDIQYVPRSVVFDEGKSVVKRAVVGGLLLGPLGAVVGGMSGIGTKKKEKFKGYVVVNFWDPKPDQPASLLMSVEDENTAKRFCERVLKEKEPRGSLVAQP